jgi:hypothetical protein
MAHVDQQFLEADLVGPRMRRDLFADDIGPLAPQAGLQEFAFKTEPASQTIEDNCD